MPRLSACSAQSSSTALSTLELGNAIDGLCVCLFDANLFGSSMNGKMLKKHTVPCLHFPFTYRERVKTMLSILKNTYVPHSGISVLALTECYIVFHFKQGNGFFQFSFGKGCKTFLPPNLADIANASQFRLREMPRV